MSDSKTVFISFNTTPNAANDSVYDQPEPPTPHESRLRCELWFGCESMACRVHGCMNASGNQGGAACHPFQHSSLHQNPISGGSYEQI